MDKNHFNSVEDNYLKAIYRLSKEKSNLHVLEKTAYDSSLELKTNDTQVVIVSRQVAKNSLVTV